MSFMQTIIKIVRHLYKVSVRKIRTWKEHLLHTLKDRKGRWYLIRDLFLALLAFSVVFIALFLLWASSLKTPDISSFNDRILSQSAKIYDRTGTILLYDLSTEARRTVVPFDQISPNVKNATIAIEDASFYQNGGIKVSSIIRAVLVDIFTLSRSQGGSTITQQVIKNTLLTNDKSFARKFKEWILAIKLDESTDKDTILNLYLNNTPYGGNIYGVEEASETFFGKKAVDLDIAEAAYIAGMAQAPSYYSPYGSHTDQLVVRKNLVLKKMLENNFIDEEQYNTALNEIVSFQPKTIGGIKAPHFVMFIRDYLEQKYGDDLLLRGGLTITTTLDYDLEQKAESVVKNYITTSGPKLKANNAALVVIDPKTGQILTMVGSADYFNTDIDGNFNVATAHRQPGSAFKPFAYATAFNEGYTPSTPVYDVPTVFTAGCSPTDFTDINKCYAPANYDGTYLGLMSFRTALAQSRNTPAVKVLYLAGITNSIKTATAMGVQGLSNAAQYGLTIVLGGAEVSPLDMTSAYGVFANDGYRVPYTGILSVKTATGQTIEEYATSSYQVLPEQTAREINDVLSDNYARAAVFGPNYFGGRRVAMKTGTTNSSRDAWVMGYTPNLSVGVWMGNTDNTPMVQSASAQIAAPMFKQFMDYALTKVPGADFDMPLPPDTSTKPFLTGSWVGPGSEIHSELFWIDKDNPTGPPPSNPASDVQFNLWEYGVRNWGASAQGQAALASAGTIINQTTPVQSTPSDPTVFAISYPIDKAAYNQNDVITTSLINIPNQTASVQYFLNGQLISTKTMSPFSLAFTPSQTKGIEPENELKAVAIDLLGATHESTVLFGVNQ